jgi:hypothetical protein
VLVVGRSLGGKRVGVGELPAAVGVVTDLVVLDLRPDLKKKKKR